jgi:hypothetical protein
VGGTCGGVLAGVSVRASAAVVRSTGTGGVQDGAGPDGITYGPSV